MPHIVALNQRKKKMQGAARRNSLKCGNTVVSFVDSSLSLVSAGEFAPSSIRALYNSDLVEC